MAAIETLEKIGNAWTHPKTGEVRYYIDAEKVADMAGISGTAYGRGDRALSRTEFGRLLGCKFWLDTEGELHIKGCMPLTLIEGMKTAEDLIREAVAQAIADAEPVEETETTCTCGGSDHDGRIIINTPCGLRYIDVPDYQGETLWEAIAKYDAANNTDLEERLEVDDIVAAGQGGTAYSCSPLSFPEDFGEPVTEWVFDDCKVSEEEFYHDLHCFVVEMEKDGEIRRQTVYPRDLDDMDALKRHLIGGRSPVKSGWEDGRGNDVCWENAEEVE